MFARDAVERREGFEIQRREDLHSGERRQVLAMLLFAAIAFLRVAREQNHDRVKRRAREIAEPSIGAAVAGGAENRRPCSHPLAEFLGERRERSVIDAERTQSVTGERDRDPACVGRGGPDRSPGADFVDQPGKPRAACRGTRKAEKLVSGRERRRSRQQKVLNVLEIELCGHRCSLHVIEHRREGLFECERLLDFPSRHVRLPAVREEARALVCADELDEGLRLRLPIRREPFKLLEDGVDARRLEQLDGILGVLVEIRIEDALIYEVRIGADLEQYPPEVMQLEWRERMRMRLDGLLDPRAVGADFILGARLDLGADREAMTGRRSRIRRAVPSLQRGEVALLRNRQSLWVAPVVVGCHRALLDRSLTVPNTSAEPWPREPKG